MTTTPSSYCAYCNALEKDAVHRIYHDTEYGFPVEDDNALFGRLLLEINQAGLSWGVILKKKEAFREAYAHFDPHRLAQFTAADRDRLLRDKRIVRHRLKIKAAIDNARRIVALQDEWGSFKQWLDAHCGLRKEEWVKLFKRTFVFTGNEITSEFLRSTGYLKGAHMPSCPIYQKVQAAHPPWMRFAEHDTDR